MNQELWNFITGIMDKKLGDLKHNCPEDITDRVFCEIENDKNNLIQYNRFVDFLGRNYVNSAIGKIVKDLWSLQNLGKCRHPKSSLIKSYQLHIN